MRRDRCAQCNVLKHRTYRTQAVSVGASRVSHLSDLFSWRSPDFRAVLSPFCAFGTLALSRNDLTSVLHAVFVCVWCLLSEL